MIILLSGIIVNSIDSLGCLESEIKAIVPYSSLSISLIQAFNNLQSDKIIGSSQQNCPNDKYIDYDNSAGKRWTIWPNLMQKFQ